MGIGQFPDFRPSRCVVAFCGCALMVSVQLLL